MEVRDEEDATKCEYEYKREHDEQKEVADDVKQTSHDQAFPSHDHECKQLMTGDDGGDGGYNESETPQFDSIFMKYDMGDGCFSTESLGSLLLEMGYRASKQVINQALDDMDPQATGKITKLTFLEWFEQNADAIETTSPLIVGPTSPSCDSATPRKNGHKSPRNKRHDQSFQELTSAMLEAKNQRKQTEQDVLLLTNRLNHLRAQEKRVLKHIDTVQERTKELQRMHKRNADHKKYMESVKAEAMQGIQKNNTGHSVTSRVSCARKKLVVQQIIRQHRETVQLTKLESKALQAQVDQQMAQQQQKLHTKMNQVRQQQQLALEKREQRRELHQRQLIKSAQEKLAAEHSQRIQNERMIHKLEQEEKELIERLRKTHEIQQSACENLEHLLRPEPLSTSKPNKSEL